LVVLKGVGRRIHWYLVANMPLVVIDALNVDGESMATAADP
jgi:hypothetical protein